jgi:asparagine synthase (glutamine-hydrolysing)
MCGIFGIVSRGAPIAPDLLERGTQSLAHRGPDDSGTVILRDSANGEVEIGLGNRRLAILDLSPLGHQPMHDAETGNWIVYNGEIYNFREVRNELETTGGVFASHSDTEVILKAYARWGADCLTRFRGMFAFAIWDARRHRLFLARDPMGIKPLYYAQSGSNFLFASEVRALLSTGLVPRRIDHPGLINYLTFGSSYDPRTLVEGISALPAGYSLTWENGVVQQTLYWDIVGGGAHGLSPPDLPRDADCAAQQLRPVLEEAVRSQLVSDVPVGVFLSGGIDSSALVSILKRGGVTPVTFSIVFREAEFSEAQQSRAVAERFQTDHHQINVSQSDVLAAIPDALRAMDLPTMDGINTFFVSREARRAGVKVALSGLGGDEIFAGYSTFRSVPRMEHLAHWLHYIPLAVRTSLASAFAALVRDNDKNRKFLSLARSNGEIVHPYFVARMLFTMRQREVLFPKPGADAEHAATESLRQTFQRAPSLDPINRVSYLESRCYMLNTLLRDADSMSMSQGLEIRVPLIDHRLAEQVMALPGAWKLNATPNKLLVGALAGSLPEEIIHRPKRGFTLPFEHWMRQELCPEIESVLNAERINAGPLGGLLDGLQVQEVWRQFLRGAVSWSRPWSLYVLQRWSDLHL